MLTVSCEFAHKRAAFFSRCGNVFVPFCNFSCLGRFFLALDRFFPASEDFSHCLQKNAFFLLPRCFSAAARCFFSCFEFFPLRSDIFCWFFPLRKPFFPPNIFPESACEGFFVKKQPLYYIFTPSHLLIYIFTPSHLQIFFTPSHLQI